MVDRRPPRPGTKQAASRDRSDASRTLSKWRFRALRRAGRVVKPGREQLGANSGSARFGAEKLDESDLLFLYIFHYLPKQFIANLRHQLRTLNNVDTYNSIYYNPT